MLQQAILVEDRLEKGHQGHWPEPACPIARGDREHPITLSASSLAKDVLMAEELFKQERGQKPGRPRGQSADTKALVKRAANLLKRGMRPAQVARELGVSRSAVSNWVARYPEVRDTRRK